MDYIFPYTNFNDVNLDWILDLIKTLNETVEDITTQLEAAIAAIDQLQLDVEDLKNNKADIIVVDMSGTVISFRDGAQYPVKALFCEIVPDQDLHGYSNPWPAGGGTNRFDSETSENYFLNVNNGQVSPNTSWVTTDFIPVTATDMTLSWDSSSNSYQVNLCCYDANKNFISGSGVGVFEYRYSRSFSIPSGAVYVRFAWSIVISGNPVTRSNIRINDGTADLGYAPYANICPISGHTELKVFDEGVYDPNADPKLTVSWQDEAGVVYVGYLDVLTGTLYSTAAEIDSYNGEPINEPWTSSMDPYTPGGTPTTGAQVVYQLDDPIEYHITPEEFVTLFGDNNIWNDIGGDNYVEYRADTKLYIYYQLNP